MCPANERRRYIVKSSLIGWAHTQNDPCLCGSPKLFLHTGNTTDCEQTLLDFGHAVEPRSDKQTTGAKKTWLDYPIVLAQGWLYNVSMYLRETSRNMPFRLQLWKQVETGGSTFILVHQEKITLPTQAGLFHVSVMQYTLIP